VSKRLSLFWNALLPYLNFLTFALTTTSPANKF